MIIHKSNLNSLMESNKKSKQTPGGGKNTLDWGKIAQEQGADQRGQFSNPWIIKTFLTTTQQATSGVHPRTDRSFYSSLPFTSKVYPFLLLFVSYSEHCHECSHFISSDQDNHHSSQYKFGIHVVSLHQAWNPLPVALRSVTFKAETHQWSYKFLHRSAAEMWPTEARGEVDILRLWWYAGGKITYLLRTWQWRLSTMATLH